MGRKVAQDLFEIVFLHSIFLSPTVIMLGQYSIKIINTPFSMFIFSVYPGIE